MPVVAPDAEVVGHGLPDIGKALPGRGAVSASREEWAVSCGWLALHPSR